MKKQGYFITTAKDLIMTGKEYFRQKVPLQRETAEQFCRRKVIYG